MKKGLYLLLTVVLLIGVLVACGNSNNRDPNLVGTWELTLTTSWRFDDGAMLDGSISVWEFQGNGSGSHRNTVFENGVATNTGTFDTFEWYTTDGQLRMRSTLAGNSGEWVTRIYEVTADDRLSFDNRNTGQHNRVG